MFLIGSMFTVCRLSSPSRRTYRLNLRELFGENSVGENPVRRNFCSVKITFAENSFGKSSVGADQLAKLPRRLRFKAKARTVDPKQIPARASGPRTPVGWCGELSQGGKGTATDRPTGRCSGTTFFPTEWRDFRRVKHLLKQIQGRAH